MLGIWIIASLGIILQFYEVDTVTILVIWRELQVGELRLLAQDHSLQMVRN